MKSSQILLFYEYIHQEGPKLLKGKGHAFFLVGQRGKKVKGEDIIKHIQRSYKETFKGRKVTATAIRQSVIKNLLKRGKDLRVVQVFAGYKYPSTTERYKQTATQALRVAIEQTIDAVKVK